MGSKSHLTPREYSLRFNGFLARVVAEQKGGRPEARWAEAHMPGPPGGRGKDYWGKLLKGKQAMTTEDISLIAEWLGVSPIDFVRAVHNDDLTIVGGPSDTDFPVLSRDEEQEARQSELDLTAKEGKRKGA